MAQGCLAAAERLFHRRWQGDRLMVETNGLRDGTWLDRKGSPLTDAARLTERFRRVSYGLLEIELTIDDSKAYTRPFTSKLRAAGLEQLTRIAGTRQDAV